MKKTTYINLSGMAFKIEEDAYERLGSYLDAIETRLGQEEASETLNDIESRMAEIFSGVLHLSDKAITIEDVEEVIKTLGNPDDFGVNEPENKEKPNRKKKETFKSRRLYRDPNNRILGGICTGLGTYFNIDPVLFRILFLLGIFSGVGVIAYIILWIIIPKAMTIEQHAQMTAGYDSSSSRRRTASYNREQNPDSSRIFKGLRIFLGILIVVGTTFAMFGLTIAFFVSNLRISTKGVHIGWVNEFMSVFFDSTSSVYALFGVALIIVIPIIMIFYAGLHLIFNFKRSGKLVSLAGFFIWLAGIGFIAFAAINTASQFNECAIVTQTDELQPFEGDTIFLKSTPFENYSKSMFNGSNFKVVMRDKRVEKDDRTTVYVNKQMIVEGRPIIHIINNTEKFAVTVERESRGRNTVNAEENALNIEYFWYQKENELFVDRIFSLVEGTQIRGHRLIVKIEIPKNYHVEIDPYINAFVRNF